MAKRFKLRLSKVIPSFLLCRSKHPNRLPINPVPVSIYRLSPLDRKSFDISYPSLPNPPPSTPINFSQMVEGSGGESSNDGDVSSTSPLVPKKRVGRRKGASLNVIVRNGISSSSGDSGWFSSDEDTPLAPSTNEKLKERLKPKLTEKSSTFRMKSGIQSVAVDKRSTDPHTDFKNSMIEMILEKDMIEVSDLEDLLQCFLTLNSRQHHKVIVEAFTEIWEALFSASPLNQRRLVKEKGV